MGTLLEGGLHGKTMSNFLLLGLLLSTLNRLLTNSPKLPTLLIHFTGGLLLKTALKYSLHKVNYYARMWDQLKKAERSQDCSNNKSEFAVGKHNDHQWEIIWKTRW